MGLFQRKTSGSVVCPSCGSLVGVRDDKCYLCGRANPGLWGFGPTLRHIGADFGFSQIVIGVCVTLWAITLLVSGSAMLPLSCPVARSMPPWKMSAPGAHCRFPNTFGMLITRARHGWGMALVISTLTISRITLWPSNICPPAELIISRPTRGPRRRSRSVWRFGGLKLRSSPLKTSRPSHEYFGGKHVRLRSQTSNSAESAGRPEKRFY